MIVYKSADELALMRRAGSITAEVLAAVGRAVSPGVSTKELDTLAADLIREAGATPAFLGYRGYPATLCVSPNEVVVHGIPDARRLVEGDIVSVDVGVVWRGFIGDAAATYPVGRVSPGAQRLMDVTRAALGAGIAACRPDGRLSDISHAVQTMAEQAGFSVVRDLVGHGVGREMHEDPQVPNYGAAGRGPLLRPGMTIALEPMVNAGTHEIELDADGWTVRTRDGQLSAHFEHTVAIGAEGVEILTLPADGREAGPARAEHAREMGR